MQYFDSEVQLHEWGSKKYIINVSECQKKEYPLGD
jgi:hypothetical protein